MEPRGSLARAGKENGRAIKLTSNVNTPLINCFGVAGHVLWPRLRPTPTSRRCEGFAVYFFASSLHFGQARTTEDSWEAPISRSRRISQVGGLGHLLSDALAELCLGTGGSSVAVAELHSVS